MDRGPTHSGTETQILYNNYPLDEEVRDRLILTSQHVQVHGRSLPASSEMIREGSSPSSSFTTVTRNAPVASTKRTHPQTVALVIVSMITLIAGSFQSVSGKWMNLQVVARCADQTNPDCAPAGFSAPFWQSWVMYLGEATCILIYFAGKFYQKHTGKGFGPFEVPKTEQELLKKKSPIWWWAIPTCTDLAGSVMMNYATLFTYASTVQVLRNFLILTTACAQVIILRRPIRYYEWAGAIVVTTGMVVTCIYDIKSPEAVPGDSHDSWIGIVLTLGGTLINTVQILLEEGLVKHYYIPVLKAVGYEGCFGIIIGGLALVVLNLGGWEDEKAAFYQMGHSSKLLASQFTYYICVIGFNGAGLAVALLGSGLLRTVLFSARSIIIWMFEMCAKWNVFDWYNFGGLILCFVGSLWFNNIIRFPCIPKFQGFLERQAGCCGLRMNYDVPDEVEQALEEMSSRSSRSRGGKGLESSGATAEP